MDIRFQPLVINRDQRQNRVSAGLNHSRLDLKVAANVAQVVVDVVTFSQSRYSLRGVVARGDNVKVDYEICLMLKR